ncbi:hypothetical protein LCGC14_3109470 [marine sediment metagenome]|uniref:Uncharacterized protein n=1 Tax=marine sediment metagenome TaxID=412755 RepID=A0A0F8W5Y7_9ZZZZ
MRENKHENKREYKLIPIEETEKYGIDSVDDRGLVPIKPPTDFTCSTCTRFITASHGGIRCRKCGHLYCIHSECINPSYFRDSLDMTMQSIEVCHKCEGLIFPKAKQTVIHIHPIPSHGRMVLITPPPRHGREIKQLPEKTVKPDLRKVGYYEL